MFKYFIALELLCALYKFLHVFEVIADTLVHMDLLHINRSCLYLVDELLIAFILPDPEPLIIRIL